MTRWTRLHGALVRCGIASSLILIIAACTTTATRDTERGGQRTYAFVVLGEEGRAVARVITPAAACPPIQIDGKTEPMEIRARPETVPLRPTRSDPALSKPSAFPVLVCDKAIPAGAGRASVLGRRLPLPNPNPHRIVVIGDTGCRIKTSDNAFQACDDAAKWPFAAVASASAAANPDLVIHVGDYHYRENACPSGNVGCAGSPWGYGWDAWEADVFAPGEKLMEAAPWILVRGNHESCNRAGQGWWRFLDPRPLVPRRNCDLAADDSIGDYSEPYAVPLGTGHDADTQFIVFDSSLVGVMPLAASDPMHIKYRAQFEQAFALAARQPNAFFLNHHPVLAFAPNPATPNAPYPGNGALQSVLATFNPTALYPPSVKALLSGHVHLFEVVSFSTPQPAQFVSGNGGDWIDTPLPQPLPAGVVPVPGSTMSTLVATNRFGFMTMDRDGPRWRIVAHDAHSAPLFVCTLVERQAICAAAAPR